MFSKMWTMKSIENYSDNIKRLKQAIDNANAILIGAGAGLSASAGYTYDGVRFQKHFADFNQKYGISDMYFGRFLSIRNTGRILGVVVKTYLL